MSVRLKRNRIAAELETVISITLGLLLFFEVLGSSFLYSGFSGYALFSTTWMIFLRGVLGGAVLLQMLLDKANWKQWLFLGVFLLLSGMTVLARKNFYFFDAMFVSLFYSSHFSYRKVVSLFYKTIGAGTGAVIVLAFHFRQQLPLFGRGERQRFALGFSHPNMLGAVLLFLAVLFLLHKGAGLRQRDALIVFLIGLFVYTVPNSFTASAVIFLLAAVTEISLLLKKTGRVPKKPMCQWKRLRLFSQIVMPLMFVGMFAVLLSMQNEAVSAFVKNLSETFHMRFDLGNKLYQEYGLTLFGPELSLQPIPAVITDSLFFCWPLAAGLVPTGFLIWFYNRCVKKAFDKNAYLLAATLLLMLFHGMMEHIFISLIPSFFFILPFCRQEEEDCFRLE